MLLNMCAVIFAVLAPPCDDVKCRKCGKKASKYERYVSPTGNGTSEIDSLLLEQQRHI